MRVFSHGYFYVQWLYIIIKFQSINQAHSLVNNCVRGGGYYKSALLSLKSVLFLSTVVILFFYLVICFCGYHHSRAFMGNIQCAFLASKLCLLARNTSETNFSRDHKTSMFPCLHILLGHLCILLTCILPFPSSSGESLWKIFSTFCSPLLGHSWLTITAHI